MEELRGALGHLYEQFGHNEVTVALSQYLDVLVAKVQREELDKWKSTSK